MIPSTDGNALSPTKPTVSPTTPIVTDPSASSSAVIGDKTSSSGTSSATGKNNKKVKNQTSSEKSASQTSSAAQSNQSDPGANIVVAVSPASPVELQDGTSIVNIQSGVATLSNGKQANLADLGATKNSNGTYSVTNKKGDKVTLPETGEKTSLLTLLGVALAGMFLLLKKQKN